MQPSRDGDSKRITRTGDEVRIHTWTLKDGPGVDRLRQCRSHPCAHLRTACTATRTVRGDSVVYVDGTTVAKTRAAAEARRGMRQSGYPKRAATARLTEASSERWTSPVTSRATQ